MIMDERPDRLTDRPEALTPTVEIPARTRHQHRQQITHIMEAAAGLLHIAPIRAPRPTRLPGGEP
jgi:hypothetical protein